MKNIEALTLNKGNFKVLFSAYNKIVDDSIYSSYNGEGIK